MGPCLLLVTPPEPVPTDAPAPHAVRSVEGTTWAFCSGNMKASFQSGGIAAITGASRNPVTGQPHTLECGGSRWKQTGSHVVFDCNGFTIYDVEMDGDRLIGRWYRDPKATHERTRAEGAATCLQLVPR